MKPKSRNASRGAGPAGSSKTVVCSSCRLLWLLVLQTVVFMFGSSFFLIHHHLKLEEDYARLQKVKESQDAQLRQRREEYCAPPLEALDANETRRILLVHIGKTGGETLKHVLRIGCLVRSNQVQQDSCWRKFSAQYHNHLDDTALATTTTTTTSTTREPILSKLVTGYFHYRRTTPQAALNHSTHFLFTVRHPLARIQSWFRYISPLNCVTKNNINNSNNTADNNKHRPKLDWSKHAKMKTEGLPVNCRVREALKTDSKSPEAQFFACFPTLEFMAKAVPALAQLKGQQKEPGKGQQDQKTQQQVDPKCVQILVEILLSNSRRYWGPSETLLGHFVLNYHYYAQRTMALNPDVTILAVRTESMWPDLIRLDQFLGGTGSFRSQGLRVTHHSETFVDQALLSKEASQHLCCVLQHELQLYRTIVERATNLNETERHSSLLQSFQYCHMDSWEQLLATCRPYRRLTKQRNLSV